MRVFRDIDDFPADARGAAIALGNFDGVHPGHAALIAAARALSPAAGVLTFSPHPRLFINPGEAPFLLTPGEARIAALRTAGADFCVELAFTKALASMPPEDFAMEILAKRLGARHLVFGHDFRFGAGRKGDAALLRSLGARCGFSVNVVEPVRDSQGEIYSSTRVRDLLRAGDVEAAARVLGRPWAIGVSPMADQMADQAESGSAMLFRFGAHLKPAPGLYVVRLSTVDGTFADASLLVSGDDDIGRLHPLYADVLPSFYPLSVAFVAFLGARDARLRAERYRQPETFWSARGRTAGKEDHVREF